MVTSDTQKGKQAHRDDPMVVALSKKHQSLAERYGAQAIRKNHGEQGTTKASEHQRQANSTSAFDGRDGEHCKQQNKYQHEVDPLRESTWDHAVSVVLLLMLVLPWIMLSVGPAVLSWFHIAISFPLPLWTRISFTIVGCIASFFVWVRGSGNWI